MKVITYRWDIPEEVVAATWSQDPEMLRVFVEKYRTWQVELYKLLKEENVVGTLHDSKVVCKVMREITDTVFRQSYHEFAEWYWVAFFDAFPLLESLLQHLREQIDSEVVRLMTGEIKEENNLDFPKTPLGVIQSTVQSLMNRHVKDMEGMLGRYFDGTIQRYNRLFVVEAKGDCVDCELENLIWTGSKFRIEGFGDIQMIPV